MGRGVRRGEEKGRGKIRGKGGKGNKKKDLLDLVGKHSRKQSIIGE